MSVQYPYTKTKKIDLEDYFGRKMELFERYHSGDLKPYNVYLSRRFLDELYRFKDCLKDRESFDDLSEVSKYLRSLRTRFYIDDGCIDSVIEALSKKLSVLKSSDLSFRSYMYGIWFVLDDRGDTELFPFVMGYVDRDIGWLFFEINEPFSEDRDFTPRRTRSSFSH